MFERFTERARRVTVLAHEHARELHSEMIEPGHLLLGMLHEGEGIAARMLHSRQLTLDKVRKELFDGPKGSESAETITAAHLRQTSQTKKVFEYALREALAFGHNYIGTEHLLLGVIREGSLAKFCGDHDLDAGSTRLFIKDLDQPVVTQEDPTIIDAMAQMITYDWDITPGYAKELARRQLEHLHEHGYRIVKQSAQPTSKPVPRVRGITGTEDCDLPGCGTTTTCWKCSV